MVEQKCSTIVVDDPFPTSDGRYEGVLFACRHKCGSSTSWATIHDRTPKLAQPGNHVGGPCRGWCPLSR
jgi:hypothetical protein